MANDAPIQFKGTTLKIIQTQLRSADLAALHRALGELTGNNADFFEQELTLLDFSLTEPPPESIDWPALCALLKRSGLQAIATHGLPPGLAASSRAAGLPTANEGNMSRSAPPRATEAVPDTPPAPAEAPAALPPTPPEAPPRTVILDKPLRSGQRFYARGGDLVVTAMVSAGAEVIADGNIHVYAPLRGRALAGASGDRAARIFTTCLQAELVSVAGLYRTFEAGVPAALAGQAACIALIGEAGEARLDVAPLALR